MPGCEFADHKYDSTCATNLCATNLCDAVGVKRSGLYADWVRCYALARNCGEQDVQHECVYPAGKKRRERDVGT